MHLAPMLLAVLSASAGAMRPPGITRRDALQGISVLSLVPPTALFAADISDPLSLRLTEAKSKLIAAQPALESGQNFDQVRQAVKKTITPLTMKGYLGSSVKSRSQEGEGSPDLADARLALLRSLGIVDRYCYKRQTSLSFGAQPDESAAAITALADAIASLDTVISLL